ncbi:hypothetical protein PROFUN_12437 [Planoprotostelium fungivorum]|uniref:Uncharacterized protein n=1 Tax=Planoprotostelium fungivorum TaxID=1890364 RepID=A0A2P6N5R0_9EUKA|nr:hypothetical protein PROFUN_12437 [Planoprotostelium fungivorum]
MSGRTYSYKGHGTNSQVSGCFASQHSKMQGNHYCSRDYGSGAKNNNSYHYSNNDGSYYYSNANGSTYYNNGQGESAYNPPSNSRR